ncbi:C39 family peptidase [Micromonospora sp. NPDC050397]|uniref:C39 family peptidase n=1 Tax=Micromonospora sp. NPDC050397 TaxID=3364279 RepID=UPI0038512369
MKHRQQLRLRRIVTASPYRVSVVSAAVLAVGLTTGILLTQGHESALPDTSAVAVSEKLGGQAAGEIAPSLTTPTPDAPAPVATSAAPSPTQSAPAAAKKATPTAVKAVKKAPPAAKTLDYDYEAQINGWYCGPAATRIALTARDKTPSQDAVASALGTTMNGTNSADDTTRGLNSLAKTNFYSSTFIPGTPSPAQMDRLQADVVHAISSGYAVVANIVGSATDVDGGWHAYDGGHYLTVVGYRDNGRTVQIADPAFVNGVSSYWMSTIDLANWMASRGYSA